MKKSQIITILIIIVVTLAIAILFLLGSGRIALSPTIIDDVSNNIVDTSGKTTDISQNNNEPTINTQILGNKADLVSFSIKPGQKVSSGEQKVTGTVKGGYFFEANILLRLLDSNKKVLSEGNGNAIGEWMTSGPVSFQANIDFTGLPIGPAFIEIHNDNPGWPDEGFNKSILIPVIIQ